MAHVNELRVDEMQQTVREIFEVKSGYKDEPSQARMLEKHFRYFDSDGSGIIDFNEFCVAMTRLNFVGVQSEMEALFDRFDEDLSGTLDYAEFAKGIYNLGSKMVPTGESRSIIERVKAKILERGGKNGIRTLTAILRRMDQNGNLCLEKEELYEGLFQYGIRDIDTSEGGEMDKIFSYFDRDNSGRISLTEFLCGVRGTMVKRRIKIVKQAYDRLDRSGDGFITMEDIEDCYDASQHPEVIAGNLSPSDALLEFMRVFEDGPGDGIITWHEFLQYYRDISAGVDSDDEFELIIRNSWHISGGEGCCENTSCRRVLVTHYDGSQEIVEVKDDLGLRFGDSKAVMNKLLTQGVTDIERIDLTG